MGLFDKVKSTLGTDRTGTDESMDSDPEVSSDPFTVPESVVEDKVNVSKRIEIILEHYDDVTGREARTIAETLKEHLEDTDGYSHDQIKQDLESEVDLDDNTLETIVWTETASINLIDRVEGYLENGRDDDVYKLTVSDNGHPICTDARDEIEERDGVSLEEMTRILIENAEEHDDGTPERMDHWVPHERCKHSVVRHVGM